MAVHQAPQRASLEPVHFKLRPKQYEFVYSPAKFTFFIGGIGGGKTTSGAVKAILHMIDHPRSFGLIGSPTYTMLRDTTLRAFLELAPVGFVRAHNKVEGKITAINGSEVLLRSMDQPDRNRGTNLGWFWLDEAPLCGYYSWRVMKGRLRAKDTELKGWATGTPKGKDGFWVDFERDHLPNHHLVRSSTYENKKNLPDGYIESLGYEGSFFEQEVMGLFTAFEGLVYSFGTDRHSRPFHLGTPKYKRLKTIVGGVDWGYTNPAVALIFGIDGDDRVWQLDEFYQRHLPLEEFIAQVVALTRQYQVTAWYCDPAEPGHITSLRAKLDGEMLDCQVKAGDNRVTLGIQSVQRFLAERGDGLPGLIVDPRCVNTIAEFGSYQYASVDQQQRNPNEKPLKQSDHAMDAVRYCLQTHYGSGAHAVIPTAVTRLTRPPSLPGVTLEQQDEIDAQVAALEGQRLEQIERRRAQLANFFKQIT